MAARTGAADGKTELNREEAKKPAADSGHGQSICPTSGLALPKQQRCTRQRKRRTAQGHEPERVPKQRGQHAGYQGHACVLQKHLAGRG
jgi:hypothetical protein